MRTKSKLSIVALFSCCTLMSVGFANWVISQPTDPININGNLSADNVNVITGNDYIYPDIDNIVGLNYNLLGFAKSNKVEGEEGYNDPYYGVLTVPFILNGGKCKELIGELITLTVTVGYNHDPKDEAANIFSSDAESCFVKGVVAENGFVDSVSGALSNNTYIISAEIDLSSISEDSEIEIVVTYYFNMLNKENFEAFFLEPFGSDQSLQFEIVAEIAEA